jgi:hypothetical protein
MEGPGMKLIANDIGRVILLFPVEEMTPLRGMRLHDLVREITNRYDFKFPPEINRPWREIEGRPVEFRQGQMVRGDQRIVVNLCTIFQDGVVAECPTTDDAETFAGDLIGWARDAFGFREPFKSPTIVFRSNVVVEFDRAADSLINKWAEVSRLMESFASIHLKMQQPIRIRTIQFSSDPTKVTGGATADFAIERRANAPYEQNRFWCSGPLKTQELIDFLEKLERTAI